MKIIAFGASTSKNSINKILASFTSSLAKNCTYEVLDLNDYPLPLYSESFEQNNGFPKEIYNFLEDIKKGDALVISIAEHNGNYTSAFKNLIDWCSRVQRDFLENKQIVLLSTSPGPGGAKVALSLAKSSMKFFSGNVVADLSVPSFYENFNVDENKIMNSELENKLQKIINSFEK